MISLIDTNILVYRVDYRFPGKQRIATELLRDGLRKDNIRIAHQALIEFLSVTTRPRKPEGALLDAAEAIRETEEMLSQFSVLYPNSDLFRTALRGSAAYQLSWFDAHMWAYAEHFGIQEIVSEDFQHDRLYGSVRARNPFIALHS